MLVGPLSLGGDIMSNTEAKVRSRVIANEAHELYRSNLYTNAQIGEMLGVSAAQVGRILKRDFGVECRPLKERTRDQMVKAEDRLDVVMPRERKMRRTVAQLEDLVATKDQLMARGAAEAAAALAAKDEEIAALKAENERLKARVAELEAAPEVDPTEVAEPEEVVAVAASAEQNDRRDEWREYVRECMANRRNPLRYDLWLKEAEPAAAPADERAELENELRAYGGEWNEALRAWVYGRYIPRDLLTKAAAFHGVAPGNVFETTVFRELADAKRARNGGEVAETSWDG